MSNTPDKVWIAHRPYDQDVRVFAEYDSFARLWRVRQRKREVVLCSHLCLRDAEYHPGGVVSGYIATFQETRRLHEDHGHDDDEVFDYDCLTYDGERWVTEAGIPIGESHYADMAAWEENLILAINTERTIR